MSRAEFDVYRDDYEAVVDRSIDFSGLKHDFFMVAKAELLQEIADRELGDAKAANLLDVGCGVGRLHGHLGGRFASVSGCDVSSESLSRAATDNPSVGYRLSAATRLPYDDGAFDLVTTSCVMHHVPPADWPSFTAELRRVTRPGGIAAVIEHNPLNPLTRLAVARCPFDADAVLLRAGRTKRLLRDAGFKTPRSRHFLLLPSAAGWARKIERAFGAVPIGAQYVAFGGA